MDFPIFPMPNFAAIFMHLILFAIKCLFTIFNFQDTSVSTNMISNKCMIYHMKVHIVNYDLGPKKCQTPEFIFCLFEQMNPKMAIVLCRNLLKIMKVFKSEI